MSLIGCFFNLKVKDFSGTNRGNTVGTDNNNLDCKELMDMISNGLIVFIFIKIHK